MFCFFFKKINKIDKPLARFTKKKREDPNKIRNERGEIAINTTEIQKIIREHYKQQIGQPRRNGQVSRNIQPTKTEARRNR